MKTCIEIPAPEFRALIGPGVYIYVLGDAALYVGASNLVLKRASQREHEQADTARSECDRVLFLPCLSFKDAYRLESQLIFDLRPKYNKRKNSGACVLVDKLSLTHSMAQRVALAVNRCK